MSSQKVLEGGALHGNGLWVSLPCECLQKVPRLPENKAVNWTQWLHTNQACLELPEGSNVKVENISTPPLTPSVSISVFGCLPPPGLLQ